MLREAPEGHSGLGFGIQCWSQRPRRSHKDGQSDINYQYITGQDIYKKEVSFKFWAGIVEGCMYERILSLLQGSKDESDIMDHFGFP